MGNGERERERETDRDRQRQRRKPVKEFKENEKRDPMEVRCAARKEENEEKGGRLTSLLPSSSGLCSKFTLTV